MELLIFLVCLAASTAGGICGITLICLYNAWRFA